MLFDTQVQTFDIQLAIPDGERPDHLEVRAIVGTVLPFATAPGQNGVPLPLGVIRFALDKSGVENLGNALVDAAEKLVARPNIEVASTLAGVDDAAKFGSSLRGS